MSGQALPAAQRIRRRPEFERIYREGTRIHGRFMTLFVMSNGGSAPRLGVAATRKIGTAVERNRAKRLSREVFRRHDSIAAIDVVVVPRREMLDAPFIRIAADFDAALTRGRRQLSSTRVSRRGREPRNRRDRTV